MIITGTFLKYPPSFKHHSYSCRCNVGYNQTTSSPADGGSSCVPVCPGGCVNGSCVAPGRCRCQFGWVGPRCDSRCLCHGHSDCAGPDRLDECLR